MPTIENYGTVSNILIEQDGAVRTLKEWAEYYQIPYKTVAMRYKRGHTDPNKLFFKSKVGLSIREIEHEPDRKPKSETKVIPKKPKFVEKVNPDGTVDLVEVTDD
jgi:hypothetical protein